MTLADWSVVTLESNTSPVYQFSSPTSPLAPSEDSPAIRAVATAQGNPILSEKITLLFFPTTGSITDANSITKNVKGVSEGIIETWFLLQDNGASSGLSSYIGAGICFRRSGTNYYIARVKKDYGSTGGSRWEIIKKDNIGFTTIASGLLSTDLSENVWHRMKITFYVDSSVLKLKFEIQFNGSASYETLGGTEHSDASNMNDGDSNNELGLICHSDFVKANFGGFDVTFDGTSIFTSS